MITPIKFSSLIGLVILSSLIAIQPGFALFGSSEKTHEHKELYIQNHSNIDKKFRAADGSVYNLKLELFIPHPENGDIVVSTFYDEASERSIEDIAWINVSNKNIEKRIEKFSTRKEVNKVYEQLAIDHNPGLAYDRLTQEKHIINKLFYFHKNDIIGKKINSKNVGENFLEISFSNKDKKRIDVNKYVYQEMTYNVVELPVKRSKKKKDKDAKADPAEQAFLPSSAKAGEPAPSRQPIIVSPLNPVNVAPAGAENPYLNPGTSETAQELHDAQTALEEFSRQVYPQNYSEQPSANTESEVDPSELNQMQKMLDDEYYGDEEGDEEF